MDRGRFSDRIGLSRRRSVMQLDDLDEDLRAAIWNVILGLLVERFQPHLNSPAASLVRGVFRDVLNVPMDEAPSREGERVNG